MPPPFVFQSMEIDHRVYGNTLIMRIFGVTETGDSVCCHVYNFRPYFYVYGPSSPESFLGPSVDVEPVKKANIMYYIKEEEDNLIFFRVTVNKPHLVYYYARKLEELDYKIFEANIDVEIRFMVDTGLTGCCWIECPRWKRTEIKKTFCPWEVDVDKGDLIVHNPEGKWASLAPFTILSFDIECGGRKGIFPEPEHDPVIQIGNVVKDKKVIFTLGRCESIPDARVICCDDELVMLERWSEYVTNEADPEVLTGYNINNFDLLYVIKRAERLRSKSFNLGRVKGGRSVVVKESTFFSRQGGCRKNILVNTEDRCQFDMMTFLLREYKLRSYTLNAVAYQFLGQQKGDVHHSVISDLQAGGPRMRRNLAEYCLKDAQLPSLLMKNLAAFVRYAEMARVTGIPLSFVIRRGQQIKIVAQLLRIAASRNLILPSPLSSRGREDDYYEGATVIEPRRGFYNCPVVILDFASLYPSIMIAHNLCYTTLWKKDNTDDPLPSYVKTTPSGDQFVQREKGLLPEILESLISARKRVKQELKNETLADKREILDSRQLALKISANSVYGFTGALAYGKLPCKEISRSVTAYGREMIDFTRQRIEEKYKGSRVIYGDTDSVMIQFENVSELRRAIEMGKEAAAYVTSQFPPPIKLEFEKVYFPFLLVNKKKYAALSFTRERDDEGKLDVKGIEVVRRDNCRLVVEVMNECLRKILVDRRPEDAVSYVKNIIADLLGDRIDPSKLVITKELSKKSYKAKNLAHIVLAEKKRKRGDGTVQLGDRIPYVMVEGLKNRPAYEKAEDPIYALDHNLPVDCDYYLNNQLRKPIARIFEPILGTRVESELFRGDHTRVKVKRSYNWGPMARFVMPKKSCVGCRIPVRDDDSSLCQYCQPAEKEIYTKEMEKLRELKKNHAQYLTRCQQCQNNFHLEEIPCTNVDCPIFYSRHKAKIDLKRQEKKILDW